MPKPVWVPPVPLSFQFTELLVCLVFGIQCSTTKVVLTWNGKSSQWLVDHGHYCTIRSHWQCLRSSHPSTTLWHLEVGSQINRLNYPWPLISELSVTVLLSTITDCKWNRCFIQALLRLGLHLMISFCFCHPRMIRQSKVVVNPEIPVAIYSHPVMIFTFMSPDNNPSNFN